MPSESGKSVRAIADMQAADSILNVSAALRGVSEALAYRAEIEDDDMLVLLASVLDDQAEELRKLARWEADKAEMKTS